MVKARAGRRKKRVKAQAKIARDKEEIAKVGNQISTKANDLIPNQSKIDSSKPTDDALIPTENNGNSHPVKVNQSHDHAHNIATLEKGMTETLKTGNNSPDIQTTSENNGNSQSGKTFVEVVTNSANLKIREKIKTTTFHTLRDILESTSKSKINEDDETVNVYNKTKNYASFCLSLMLALPTKDIEEEDAPIEAIIRMNAMIKSLVNKIPSIRIAPWTMKLGDKGRLLSELPEDVDIVEKYAYDYSRFILPGKNVYYQLHIVFDRNKSSKGEISEVIMGLKKPRIQFMNLSHSDALCPQ